MSQTAQSEHANFQNFYKKKCVTEKYQVGGNKIHIRSKSK